MRHDVSVETIAEYRHGIRGEGPEVDPLHHIDRLDLFWTTANIGEAMPGVITPLTWTLFGPAIEAMVRRSFVALGAFTADELPYPPRDDYRYCRAFHGRTAMDVTALAAFGDRMPGTTGQQVVAGLVGEVPAGMEFHPTQRRAAHVLVGLARQHVAMPRQLAVAAPATARWWTSELRRIEGLTDPGEVAAAFHAAGDRFFANLHIQGLTTFATVQPVYDVLTRLAVRAGLENAAGLTAGYGDVPETAVVTALWRASRGEIDLDEVVAVHGFHGPREGELSGTMWREDPAPLVRAIEGYARQGEDQDPRVREEQLRRRRRELEQQVVASVPRAARPLVRGLLRRAERTIPLRGTAKDAFLQAFDVCRAAARRLGELQVAAGALDDVEDVFFLRVEEVAGRLPADVRDRVAFRRERRAEHLTVRIPPAWRGQPVPLPVSEAGGERRAGVSGTGVSPGLVEGVVRVVEAGDFEDVEDGEILVAATTDPSWASVLFLARALVVDIGGHLSHAAVVARELGVPCVVNTIDGTAALRTGDRVRVDGDRGTVTILEPVAADAVQTDPHPAAAVPAADPEIVVLAAEDLPLVQAIRLKGRVRAADLADVLDADATGLLDRLRALEATGVVAARGELFRTTPAGQESLAAALAAERAGVAEGLVPQVYAAFVPLNARFKEAVSHWQVRDGEVNDHTDADQDAPVLLRVRTVHDELVGVLEPLVREVPRLGGYVRRLDLALRHVAGGEHRWLLDPRIDSYHTVWFELHEELMGIGGLERLAEALAGRAE